MGLLVNFSWLVEEKMETKVASGNQSCFILAIPHPVAHSPVLSMRTDLYRSFLPETAGFRQAGRNIDIC